MGGGECEELWQDILNFFDDGKGSDEYYFLGAVVVFKENNILNIIDGQQRTTTLMLLIRAIWEKAKNFNDDYLKLKNDLTQCLWHTDGKSGKANFSSIRLTSKVASQKDNEVLTNILGENLPEFSDKLNSAYEKNYDFFTKKLDEYAKKQPTIWLDFVLCILHKCILLPIECDSCDNALKIFNTLNNRGISLSMADILKGLIYENLNTQELKDEFIDKWQDLDENIEKSSVKNIDFLFLQFEHIVRAEYDEIDTVMPSPLDFYTKKDALNSKKKNVNFGANNDLLMQEDFFDSIVKLGEFWCDIDNLLSLEAKKYYLALSIYQNKLWQMVVSMAFYQYKNPKILDTILPQILAYLALALILNKGGNSGIFWGLMKANINLKNKKEGIFEAGLNIPSMPSFEIFNQNTQNMLPKQIRFLLLTRTLATYPNQNFEWNANKKNYDLIKCDIEHIYPQNPKRAYNSDKAKMQHIINNIGNKILLEKKLNIDASDKFFSIKKESYKKSSVLEANDICKLDSWNEMQAQKRSKEIYSDLKDFIQKQLPFARN